MIKSEENNVETDLDVIKDVFNKCKSGDVIAFSGKRIFSVVIKMLQKTLLDPGDDTYKFSHVSIIIKEPWTDNKFISSESLWNPLKGYKGVAQIPLQNRLLNYKGTLTLYKLQKNGNDFELSKEQKLKLKLSTERYKGLHFEKGLISMLKSAIDNNKYIKENKKDTSSLFCSEHSSQTYIDIGLLNNKKPSSEFSPSEFINAKLKKGYTLKKKNNR